MSGNSLGAETPLSHEQLEKLAQATHDDLVALLASLGVDAPPPPVGAGMVRILLQRAVAAGYLHWASSQELAALDAAGTLGGKVGGKAESAAAGTHADAMLADTPIDTPVAMPAGQTIRQDPLFYPAEDGLARRVVVTEEDMNLYELWPKSDRSPIAMRPGFCGLLATEAVDFDTGRVDLTSPLVDRRSEQCSPCSILRLDVTTWLVIDTQTRAAFYYRYTGTWS